MHNIYQGQLASDGALNTSFDNDSSGRWLFDDYSALQGLAAYKYIATAIGNTAEAEYAQNAYTSLLNSVNSDLTANQIANKFSWLPCELTVPMSADRCNTFNDANWASSKTPITGYVFAAVVFWMFCFGMSRYSIYTENRLQTGHRRR